MRPFRPRSRAVLALAWLVAAVPAPVSFGAPPDVPTTSHASQLPKLQCASAADLVPCSQPAPADWRRSQAPIADVVPVRQPDIEPRVTSVPAAVVVGGLLIASMGITQRIRRVRGTRP